MQSTGVRDFAVLNEEEIAEFQAELARHIGAGEATRIPWLRRARLMPDGTWQATYRKPKLSNLGDVRDRPWNADGINGPPRHRDSGRHEGVASVLAAGPIEEVVALLASDANPEKEVERREALFREAWAAEDAKAAREAEAFRQGRKAEEEYKRRRPERWAALPQLQKALYHAAAGSHGQVGSALQDVARLLGLPPDDWRLNQVPATFERGNT